LAAATIFVVRVSSRVDAKAPVEETMFPKFDYYLDESDPDVVVLRRQDGAFVAAFSARGFAKEGVIAAAEEDYKALLEEHASSLGIVHPSEHKNTPT
jgi:hypothetical protein